MPLLRVRSVSTKELSVKARPPEETTPGNTPVSHGNRRVPQVEVGAGDGRVDGPGYRDHATGGVHGAGGDRLQAPGLQREPEVHRLDGVPERPGTGQVEHVPAGYHVDTPAVGEHQRHQVIRVLPDLGDRV